MRKVGERRLSGGAFQLLDEVVEVKQRTTLTLVSSRKERESGM